MMSIRPSPSKSPVVTPFHHPLSWLMVTFCWLSVAGCGLLVTGASQWTRTQNLSTATLAAGLAFQVLIPHDPAVVQSVCLVRRAHHQSKLHPQHRRLVPSHHLVNRSSVPGLKSPSAVVSIFPLPPAP